MKRLVFLEAMCLSVNAQVRETTQRFWSLCSEALELEDYEWFKEALGATSIPPDFAAKGQKRREPLPSRTD
jgi:hypothetical protein